MKIGRDDYINTNGTSKRGEVYASLEELQMLFGNAELLKTEYRDADTPWYEWTLCVIDNEGAEHAATVYKLNGFRPQFNARCWWAVGGHSNEVALAVVNYINERVEVIAEHIRLKEKQKMDIKQQAHEAQERMWQAYCKERDIDEYAQRFFTEQDAAQWHEYAAAMSA